MLGSSHTESESSKPPIDCANCVGACCRNMRFENISAEDIAVLSGENQPIEVPNQMELSAMQEELQFMPSGVYFTRKSNGEYTALLAGKCPQLESNNICGVHESPKLPEACRNLPMGGLECENLRRRAGLDKPEKRRIFFLRRVS